MGTVAHLGGELFAQRAGVKFLHVPYRGAAPAITDVLAGQVDFAFATPPAVVSLIRGGNLRALATTSVDRLPALPDPPAAFAIDRELGRRGVDPEYIAAALAGYGREEELEAAVELLGTRFPSPPSGDRERDRAWRLLVRRGYEPELAYEAVRAHGRGALA